MSKLAFTVVDARIEPYAVVPTLIFRLQITEGAGEQIHAIALKCQIQMEPQTTALFFRRGKPAPGTLRRARSLGGYAENSVVDSRLADGAGFSRHDCDRCADYMHL